MSSAAPEFSRVVRAHEIGSPKQHVLEADAGQRTALATRFTLLSLDRLTASLDVKRDTNGIRIIGEVHGAGTQPCVATAEPVPFLVTERIALLLTQATPEGGEIELSSADLDVEPLEGDIVDLGEIAAQAFALGLDPYPRSAVSVAGVISEDEAVALRSPFAVLKKS